MNKISDLQDGFAVWERQLLFLPSLIIVIGIAIVRLQAEERALGLVLTTNWLSFAVATAVIIIAWYATHFMVRLKGNAGDPVLLPLTAFLTALGLVLVLRLKPDLFFAQLTWILTGLLAFCVVARLGVRIEYLCQYKYICGIVGVGLLLSAEVLGVDIGGNKNWVVLGPLRFQPSEFAKLFLIVFLAAYLSERREVLALAGKRYGFFLLPPPRFIAPLLCMLSLSLLLLVGEKDLGAALLYFGVAIIMVYMASGRLSYVAIAVVMFLLGAFICYKLFPHVQVRIDIWLNPWADPNGRAYQILQSLFALGSGGVLGAGIGCGFPSMIPEVHTDFIFAAIGEELGLAGAAAVFSAYIILIYRAFRAALAAPTDFMALTAGGLGTFLALQVFLIIAGVTKFMPMTGITLPFISYGGSSFVANSILLGMLFALSARRSSDV